jgi:pyridoxal phosphate enzyme (YggS family)
MANSQVQEIRANYLHVQEQISRAAQVSGRDPAHVRLVVVTKGHPVETVDAALQAGVRTFGENYVQEGIAKKLACTHRSGVEWHMIGHVQSRKARLVAENFHWIHSLDSLKLAGRLDRFARESGRQLPVLIECNVSGETSKFGLDAWREDEWSRLIDQLAPIFELQDLQVRGLMTMAPFLPNAEDARPYFQRLRRLKEFLTGQFPKTALSDLSMGMSADFFVAVQEGATFVRIGTAILGVRP